MLAKGYARAATLSGLTIQAGLLIINFAAIHYVFGLCPCTRSASPTATFSDALYFSVVTWTTLGYGDLLPRPELHLMAALEAAVGYMYFGLIVGVAGGILEAGRIHSPSESTH
ncbi:two pore domain potassium channel family protein [Sphingomonas sp. MA1305]|nr:two pore domain potassium channel family protein [Sphingomonas sp. MA1305]